MELHELLRAARTEHGLTQQQLADQVGSDLRSVRRWESKAGSLPGTRNLSRLRRLLQLQPSFVMELAEASSDQRIQSRLLGEYLAEEPDLRQPLEPPAFSWRLRQAMGWRDLQPVDVADALCVSRRSVTRWMDRKGAPPYFAQQHALAHLLDVPLWWLHTMYLDSCELFGHPAEHLHTEREEIARLRGVMSRPDGWTHREDRVDDDFLTEVAAASGLPVDDLRRVAYPVARPWRWSGAAFVSPAEVGSPVPARLRHALANQSRPFDDGLWDVSHATVFAAGLVGVAPETVTRWSKGQAEPTTRQVHLLAHALCIPSWTLWLLSDPHAQVPT